MQTLYSPPSNPTRYVIENLHKPLFCDAALQNPLTYQYQLEANRKENPSSGNVSHILLSSPFILPFQMIAIGNWTICCPTC